MHVGLKRIFVDAPERDAWNVFLIDQDHPSRDKTAWVDVCFGFYPGLSVGKFRENNFGGVHPGSHPRAGFRGQAVFCRLEVQGDLMFGFVGGHLQAHHGVPIGDGPRCAEHDMFDFLGGRNFPDDLSDSNLRHPTGVVADVETEACELANGNVEFADGSIGRKGRAWDVFAVKRDAVDRLERLPALGKGWRGRGL